MEKRDRAKGVESVLIQTFEDVVLRTTKTLASKDRGVEGFVVAAKLAIELGVAMKQDGRVLNSKPSSK